MTLFDIFGPSIFNIAKAYCRYAKLFWVFHLVFHTIDQRRNVNMARTVTKDVENNWQSLLN